VCCVVITGCYCSCHLATWNMQPDVRIHCSSFFLQQMMVVFEVFHFLVCLRLDKPCKQVMNSSFSGFCGSDLQVVGEVVPLVEFLWIICHVLTWNYSAFPTYSPIYQKMNGTPGCSLNTFFRFISNNISISIWVFWTHPPQSWLHDPILHGV